MRNRIAAVPLVGAFVLGVAGCAAFSEPPVDCAPPSPGPGDQVVAQCAMGERFALGGADAAVSDLATVTVDDTGAVELTLSLTEGSSRDLTAQLHIADPYLDYEEVFVTDPTAGGDCLGNAGECELSWDFTDSGYALDAAMGFEPQMWIEFSDGTDDVVVWVVQVTVGA